MFAISAFKSCTLTITHPSGGQRTYTHHGISSRKKDAKAHTAALAVSMRALAFIQSGDAGAKYILDQDKPGDGGLVLVPLDHPVEASDEAGADDPLVQEIEQACVRWGAGLFKLSWVALTGNQRESGCSTSSRCTRYTLSLSPHPRPQPHHKSQSKFSYLNLFIFDRDGLCISDPVLAEPSPFAGVCFGSRAGNSGRGEGRLR